MAADLTASDGYRLLNAGANLNGASFDLLRLISKLAARSEDDVTARDLLIRTVDKRATLQPDLSPILESLIASLGLFPYVVETAALSTGEQIALEYHRPRAQGVGDFVFHAMQKSVYDRLLAGESLLLSAPTSFGKSAVIDALVVSERWTNIVIIVPTVALIDETRRRISALGSPYKVITHPSQTPTARNVYVLTQERYLDLPEPPPVDLFIIDEFYKLDGGPNDSRAIQLNIAWDKLRRSGAQYYLIGPNIDNLSPELPSDLREQLVVTNFRTVSSNEYVVNEEADRGTLVDLCSQLSGPTLIYVRSPQRAREVGKWLLDAGIGSGSTSTSAAADWIAQNFHPDWMLGQCLRQGIGLHHGRVPRALQRHILRHFNQGDISFLVCTSTLIEGVNTIARNVVVFDKTLNGRNLDHFTFNNIRGRAGRMLHHFVGQVYLFAQAPERVENIVDIPISSQSKRVSDSALLQLPRSELSSESRARLRDIENQSILSLETIKANRGVDPNIQIQLAARILEDPRYYHSRLGWTGFPTYDQLVESCQLILTILKSRPVGPATPASVATRLERLRRNEASVPRLVADQVRFSGSVDAAVEEIVYFIRNWSSFDFPYSLMVLEGIQREVFTRLGMRPGSYSFYARRAEAHFLPEYFATLEEYGLPYQLALKLRPLGLAGETLDEVLGNLRRIAIGLPLGTDLDRYEREMLSDVVLGLG